MKEFVNNNFKFVLVITSFTLLVSIYSKEFFRKNEIIESNIEKIDYMQERHMEHMLTRLTELEKKIDETKSAVGMHSEVIFDQINVLRACDYLTYKEIIECFNYYHTDSIYKPIDYTEMSRSIYKSYFDIKKEKEEEKLKECKEKKIKIKTH